MNALLLATDSAEEESPPEWMGIQKEGKIEFKVTDSVATNGAVANSWVSYRGVGHAPKLQPSTPKQFLDRDVQRLLRTLLGGER